jgi:hypothetical protein
LQDFPAFVGRHGHLDRDVDHGRLPGKNSPAHVDIGKVTENSKNVQQPQNDGNDHNGIQNRLYGSRHRDESVDEPEKNTNHDKGYDHLN